MLYTGCLLINYCLTLYSRYIFRCLSDTSTEHFSDVSINGPCHVVTIVGTTLLVPSRPMSSHCDSFFKVTGFRRWNLLVAILQMSCSDLTKWLVTRLVVPLMATRVTYSIRWVDVRKMKAYCALLVIWCKSVIYFESLKVFEIDSIMAGFQPLWMLMG